MRGTESRLYIRITYRDAHMCTCLSLSPWKMSKSLFQSLKCTMLFSHVWLFVAAWTAACQAYLYFSITQNLLMSIESVMPSNHIVLCRPLIFLPESCPAFRSFPMSQFFTSGGQSVGASASTSVLPMNIQEWFPLWLTGLTPL